MKLAQLYFSSSLNFQLAQRVTAKIDHPWGVSTGDFPVLRLRSMSHVFEVGMHFLSSLYAHQLDLTAAAWATRSFKDSNSQARFCFAHFSNCGLSFDAAYGG